MAGMDIRAVPIRMSYNRQLSAALKMADICSVVKIYGVKSGFGCFGRRGMKHSHPQRDIVLVSCDHTEYLA